MQAALISYDFLLAPAYCEPDNIEYRVMSLIEYAQSMSALNKQPLLEIDAISKLIVAGKYPCENLFNNNLSRAEEIIYTGKDVARVVNTILTRGEDFIYENERLWDCVDKSLIPSFVGIDRHRINELEEMVEGVSICNELESRNISILHFCPVNSFSETEFAATLTMVEPAPKLPLPHTFKKTMKMFTDYRQYLASIPYEELLLNDPENVHLIREAIYCGTLHALKQRGVSLTHVNPTSFGLGAEFVSSLKANQCLLGQKFGGVCLSCIIAVLSDDPSYEINMFTKTDKREEQRTHGEYKAFRAHISKGGVGLRLMFWRRDDSYIELANVGPKQELKIELPKAVRAIFAD